MLNHIQPCHVFIKDPFPVSYIGENDSGLQYYVLYLEAGKWLYTEITAKRSYAIQKHHLTIYDIFKQSEPGEFVFSDNNEELFVKSHLIDKYLKDDGEKV